MNSKLDKQMTSTKFVRHKLQKAENGPSAKVNCFCLFTEPGDYIAYGLFTGAVTQSVLNTAKRAFVMIGAAILLREGLSTIKLVGSLISIAGVFLYTNIDSWLQPPS